MSESFSRSMRSLQADDFRLTLGVLALASVLLILWGTWFFLAEVSLYAVTENARLEVDQEAHPVDTPIAGRVVASHMVLGRTVKEGDLLVELDSRQIRFQLDEKRAEKVGLTGQLDKLKDGILAEQEAVNQARRGETSALDEARAQYQEADAAARHAEEEADRMTRIHDEGLVSDSERQRALSEAEQKRAAARAREQSLRRLGADRHLEQSEKEADLAELERQAELILAEIAGIESELSRLEHELGLHRISAPISGRLGELVPLRVGSVVAEGDRLAAVIPPGEVKVVAEFAPPEALGRVRAGEKARLRLEGFPWAQYGSLSATVARVANETQTGTIRVELTVDRVQRSAAPIQHGLPGTLEIEVERVTPAELLLRAAGRVLAKPAGGLGRQSAAPERP